MRFSTIVALSTLSLGATAAAIPVPQPVGETSDKSIQTARDLDALEGRGVKGVLFGGLAAGAIYHFWHKHKKAAAASAPPAEPAIDSREYFDDDFEARDLDALEGRGVGKVLLGAAAGALLVHEIEKHSHHHAEKAPEADDLERRGLGKLFLGAGAGALLVHEVEKHSHHSEKSPASEVDAPERRGLGKVLLGAGAGALLVHEVEKHFHASDKAPQGEALERRRLPLVL